jgi:SAM-dependent methyltransferase
MTKPTGIRASVARLLHLQTSEEKWDTQWADHRWDGLGRLDELAHYSVLAGYALHLKPGGLLRDRLHQDAFSRYLGLDFGEAIARAASRVDSRTSFVVGDLRTFEPPAVFDTIVFNESLYYAVEAAAELRRYSRWLAPDGVFLVSTHLKEAHVERWRSIDQHFAIIDRVTVTNALGTSWMCGAIKLKLSS